MALVPKVVKNLLVDEIILVDVVAFDGSPIRLPYNVNVDLLALASDEDLAKSFHLQNLEADGNIQVVSTFDTANTQATAVSGIEEGDSTFTGIKTFEGTVICYKDNASSFRLKGKDFLGDDVQSYAGMFYNAAYDTIGTLKTRAIFGANLEMDLELQSPHGLLLTAVDGTQADGVIKARSRTMVELSSRADPEVDCPKKLQIDRIDVGTFGAANTSDVEIKTNAGALHLNESGNGVSIGGCLITISGDDIVFSKAGKSVTLTMVP